MTHIFLFPPRAAFVAAVAFGFSLAAPAAATAHTGWQPSDAVAHSLLHAAAAPATAALLLAAATLAVIRARQRAPASAPGK